MNISLFLFFFFINNYFDVSKFIMSNEELNEVVILEIRQ